MLQHQILTGSANAGIHCFSVGQVSKFTFWAYGSGCDVIISSSNHHPIQVISGHSNVLITAIDCAASSGKIAVAYGKEIVIYKPELETLYANSNFWKKESQFLLDLSDKIASVLSWNLKGDELLVGSSCISLWTCVSSSDDLSTVSFHLNSSNDDPAEQDYETVFSWKQIWISGMHESPSHLSFSPTQSKYHLFASISDGDCMIKVWYSYAKHVDHVNVLSKPITDKIDFSFTYLLHPQPVVGFEWRKNLIIDHTERFSNILMSSCQDQICRIWVETKRPVSNLMHFQPVSSPGVNSSLTSETLGDKFKKTASTPVLSHTSEMLWKNFQTKSESTVLRHFHIAASINPSSDIPLLPSFNFQTISASAFDGEKMPVFTVHWLNNKFYQHQVQYNRYINENDIHSNASRGTISEECMNYSTYDKSGESLDSAVVENFVRIWRETQDALFSIHPSDGSLLVWHVDWLDEDRSSLIRQPQVCFSSRIPMVFSSGDAATVCPRMILFVNYAAEQNLLHSASCMSFKSEDNDDDKEIMIYSDVKLLSKHNDGSLNLWQISFSDANDFSSVTSISHSLRLCGHCFHMSGILSHPILPLLVTTATHADNTVSSSSVSELILWRMNPIGPLAHSGGLSELARVSCQENHFFTQVAWFSLLFPNWSLGSDNKSPSTGLIAFDDNRIQVYQAVVDASQILSEIMSPLSDDQCYSTRDVISQQSSTQPGCLLHLHTETDNAKPWGSVLFLDTFDVTLLSPSLQVMDTSNCSKFSKSYFIVMVETSGNDTFIHTWLITFYSALANVKEHRHRKTTMQLYDSSEDESEEELPFNAPSSFSMVETTLVKLATQKLDLFGAVVDTCSGVGKFNLFFMADHNEHIPAAPFHLCTLSSNGHVYFWHCNVQEKHTDKSFSCSWRMWEPPDYYSTNYSDNSLPYHIPVSGHPVLIKAANNTLLACMSIEKSTTDVGIIVSVFECSSSGGSCWKSQDVLTYSLQLSTAENLAINNLHLDWLSRQDGSFFLAMGYDSHIEIYSLAPKDLFGEDLHKGDVEHNHQLRKQASLDVHTRQKLFTSNFKGDVPSPVKSELEWRLLKWTKLTELNIHNTNCTSYAVQSDRGQSPGPVTASWARDGVLIVATETEMHVFSQWLNKDNHDQKFTKAIKIAVDDNDVPVTKGLFEVASDLCPSLQQYHPLILSELLSSGHMAAVRKILIHLAICINGDYQDTTCQQISSQLGKYHFCDQLSHIIQLCTSGNRITPLPIHDLVQNNGKIVSTAESSRSQKESADIGLSKPAEINDNLDDFLNNEDDSDELTDNELDEILGIKSHNRKKTKAVEHVDLSKFDPNYFGKEHCKVINEFLTRNQLPGLTSLDQMELMALADTLNLSNASNLQELNDEKVSSKLHAVNLGERGYAVSGGGAGSLDSCGIRYIMAVHNHLCLLNSLPASNKAALLKQGLNTCQFAWAFHSETEEEMLSLLPSVQKGSPEWPELKSFGVVWWIRSTVLLRRLVEQLARAAFLKKNDPLDAALFYLALNKKAVVCGLYRTIKDERMHQFFQRNFSEDRWRRAALKNAFALMGKQRFLHAVAFFLLAGAVQDAAEICIEKLKDFQLALLIVRLRENDKISPLLLLKSHVLPDECEGNKMKRSMLKITADSFIRSMAYWTVGKYEKSLDTLLDNLEHEDITDVFNFYVFLRSHPLLLKNKAQMKAGRLADSNVFASSIKNPTEQERQLIFQTAVVHMEAGCPMLALDCLSMLPKNIKVASTDAVVNNTVAGLNHDLASPSEQVPQEVNTIQSANRSQQEVIAVDWSQPTVEFGDDEELNLDWSEEEDAEESDDDASRPRIGFSYENPVVQVQPVLENKAIAEDEISSSDVLLQQDVVAEHMKMTACFQVFVQELKAIANAYNADGGQLRAKLYNWLENASDTLQRVFAEDSFTSCSSGLNPLSKKVTTAESLPETDESPSLSSLGAKMNSSQPPSLHELILADNEDWKARQDDFTQKRKWLVCHHNFLRTLLSYCILHDSACGVLATVRMELLLLIQESLQEKNATRSLAAPLPQPCASIPLLTSSIASCKTVVADPLTYLCHMTRDILRAVLDFPQPPHPGDETYFAKSSMLCSQAAALSTCIYQSLCDTSTPTFRSQLLRADTYSLDEVSVDGNCFSSYPSNHFTSQSVLPLYVASTTAPSQWPGVALLHAKLNSEGVSESRTKVLVLLCEVTVSVYISLLIHALYTHSTSLLYRLTNHVLGSKMWNAVFGGGAKIPIKYTKSSSNLKQMASMNIAKLRERLNHKVLSTSGDKRGSAASSGGQDSLAYREKFVPPEIGLWDWFLTKPFKIPAADDEAEYDSDAEEDSEVSSLEGEELCNDIEDRPSPESSSISYSWKIMRLAIVKIVIANLQSFFPLVGFELNELSTNSPYLFAIIRILQEWQSKLCADVVNCDSIPEDILPLMNYHSKGLSTPRPAMLRYQAILEPANTPFSGSDKVSKGCRRLWHSLVKKDHLQDMFINYIFRDDNKTTSNFRNASSQVTLSVSTNVKGFESPSRIVHKDHELITAFCINNVNSNCISVASAKDVQEIDLSDMLASDSWSWIDDASSSGEKSTLSKDDDFLLISTPAKPKGSQVFAPSTTVPWSSTSQTGQGANILLKRNLSNIRRMESHPTLPYYVTGGRDGAIYMWEWGHQHQISQFLPPGHTSKIGNIHFSSLGNKICSADGDGFVTLWQVSLSQKPFFKQLVHDRGANDFCFLSSASVLATTGLSSSSRNVAVWDTLLPKRNVLVQDFSVYEQAGGSCIKYLSRYRMLLVAGKNGQVCTYDERSLHAPVHRFVAHDAMIKCLTVDSNDRFYVTGSSNGDVKVWDSLSHKLLFASNSEHARASIFKNFGSGTMQLTLCNGHLYSCGADGSLKIKEFPTNNWV